MKIEGCHTYFSFVIKVTINYPKQKIIIKPKLLQILFVFLIILMRNLQHNIKK